MITVRADVKGLQKRWRELNRIASGRSAADHTIIPVVKNNANGFGLVNAIEALTDPALEKPAEIFATSYLSEWWVDQRVRNLTGIQKMAWIWDLEKELIREIRGDLVLCCKTMEQLKFCLDYYIFPVVVYDVGMHRGGFQMEDNQRIAEMMLDSLQYGDKKVHFGVAAHCPYEVPNQQDVKGVLPYYLDFVQCWTNLAQMMCDQGVVDHVSFANSYVFMHDDGRIQSETTHSRLGAALVCNSVPGEDAFEWKLYDYDPVVVEANVSAEVHFDHEPAGYLVENGQQEVNGYGLVLDFGYFHIPSDVKQVEVQVLDDDYFVVQSFRCQVLAQMHDMTQVLIPDNLHRLVEKHGLDHMRAVVLEKKLNQQNWNGCVQRTYAVNPYGVRFKQC